MYTMVEHEAAQAVIKVIGVGGGGGNAVAYMSENKLDGVEFICMNTDAQVLKNSNADATLQLGGNVTKGLGAGANPEIGRQAALEDRERITEMLKGTDMVFITAGMGGGTGTGAAPVIAQIAKDLDILTVAVVTRPFPFEGRRRMQVAQKGIEELQQYVDSLITIPNEKLLQVMGRETTLINAFKEANKVLYAAVHGISELITNPGLINLDFADVRTIMSETGQAIMGTGYGKGDDRATQATENAIGNKLLEDIDLRGACGILVNIAAGPNLSLREFDEVGRIINEFASEDATIKIGTSLDLSMQDDIRVTVVATGLKNAVRAPMSAPAAVAARNRTVLQPEFDAGVAIFPTPNTSRAVNKAPAPAAARQQPAARAAAPVMSATGTGGDYLDIPTFLRKQAD